MKIGVIGGGAAGFFSAIQCKINHPDVEVVILEKSSKVLSKVKISGGGRCNVTNSENDPIRLAAKYPRGEKKLKKAFREFNTTDTVQFFESRGVPLVTQVDSCIFPKSQNSQSIIDCFLSECSKLGVEIRLNQKIESILPQQDKGFTLSINNENHIFDRLIICTGGSPKISGLLWLKDLGIPVIEPFPSLFTFNIPKNSITQLMGIVVENAIVRIPTTNLIAQGPLLITHWGMSGPAILVLSAWGARVLAEKSYDFICSVNWVGEKNEEIIRQQLVSIQLENSNKKISKHGQFGLSLRLWLFILNKCELNNDKTWKELSKKEFNRLVNLLLNDEYHVNGKTTFKEEFVTAGGVDLDSVNFKTMESYTVPGLFFAGEILDIDGITGGFNFQAAWTTGYLAGKSAGIEFK
jgi:predicted Rossmann fold flavoprotein